MRLARVSVLEQEGQGFWSQADLVLSSDNSSLVMGPEAVFIPLSLTFATCKIETL